MYNFRMLHSWDAKISRIDYILLPIKRRDCATLTSSTLFLRQLTVCYTLLHS